MTDIILMVMMICFVSLLIPIVILLVYIGKELSKKNSIEENKNKNDLYRLYMDIDIIKAGEVIDNILSEYISRWVLVNITSKGDNYIKDSEVNELINSTTSKFIIEMSDVHLFYMKCLYNITDDDSLVIFVRERVKYLVLDFITDFNRIE
jgi:hypothetical protein